MKVCYSIMLCLFFIVQSYAQSPSIPYKEVKINIDGKLDESIWENLQEYTDFYNYLPTDIGLAKNQTFVKLFHDGEYLYVSAVYKDTTIKTQVNSLKRDAPIEFSDTFAMVLDAQNQEQSGYFFAVNSLGNQSDGLVGRVNEGYKLNLSWNTIWQSSTLQNGIHKQYEIAIPLKALNYDENNPVFGIQFYVRDVKNNSWIILKNVKRNYPNHDLRFTEKFRVESLPSTSASRFTITPSITLNYQNDVSNAKEQNTFKPSMDLQYNVTSSLKLDATINPDFSQIDVDQQVTNLTRFAVDFPEQRVFFLENADLFSNLGVEGVNPFYSRRIGLKNPIQFGLKLSGNVAPKTRVGILDVQTGSENDVASQNFGTFVAEQQVSKNITATGFFINRQEMDKLKFVSNYNRVAGINMGYKSNNNKWIGVANFGKSFNDETSEDNSFYNAGIWFNRKGLEWNTSIKNIGKNYITDIGFTPRLYNYDAINDITHRESYTQTAAELKYVKFYETSKFINSVRYLNYNNKTYLDKNGKLKQSSHLLNLAVYFKDLAVAYYTIKYDDVNLKYGFDPLGNGNSITSDRYHFGSLKVGYNSATNRKFRYRINVQKGKYYDGTRTVGSIRLNYQFLPFGNLELSYDINKIDLKQLGKETFHLSRFTGKVFFSNKLNWTTYLQYNTQKDNFNVNSRLQWEYKPLSYMYLVVSDNYNKDISRKNWGVAFKMNYRFDF